MQDAAKNLPDDVESLKEILLQRDAENEELRSSIAHLKLVSSTNNEENERLRNHRDRLEKEHAQLEDQVDHLQERVASLQEHINLLLAKRYGPSSEKVHPGQLLLFNEAEEVVEAEPAEESEQPVTEVPAHTRKKGGRRPLPAHLDRVEIVHELDEADRHCSEDGTALVEIGEETSEQLDVIPAQVRVLRHVRKKYACPCCKTGVHTAPIPAQPVPRSIASPGLLAHVVTGKYVDALPLYRQEVMLRRIGVDIPRSTLAHWVIQCSHLIQPLLNLMRDELLSSGYIQMDETPVQVLKEADKKPQSDSYMWVQRGGPPGQMIILYNYDPSRGQVVAERLLDGFEGHLQSDGYVAYKSVCQVDPITAIGCWAHARRKFDEALKAQPKGARSKSGRAMKGLSMIQKLYRIERQLKEASPEVRYQARQEKARPILDEIRKWLDKSLPGAPPKSLTGKALQYLDNQWDSLVRYIDSGQFHIDNNLAENAIRPFVIGRKNWLFSNSVDGARASASLYSLIETAKANKVEPYAYLRKVFMQLPKATEVETIEALLPWNVELT